MVGDVELSREPPPFRPDIGEIASREASAANRQRSANRYDRAASVRLNRSVSLTLREVIVTRKHAPGQVLPFVRCCLISQSAAHGANKECEVPKF